MIKKIKDLKDSILNPQDVMLMITVKLKKSTLDLSGMDKKDLEDREQLLKMEIVTVGKEVKENTDFKPKQIVSTKENTRFAWSLFEEEKLDGGWIKEYRISVIHMNNIEFAVEPRNYKDEL